MKAFRYFLLSTTIVIFLLVVLGNVVRVSDSAQACPDWPTCYGQFAWPGAMEARLQLLHRGLAALSALMLAISAIWAMRRRAAPVIRLPLTAGVGLMFIEIFLGAGLVLAANPMSLAAIHLALALGVLVLAVAATTAAYGLYPVQSADDHLPVIYGDETGDQKPTVRPWRSRLSFESFPMNSLTSVCQRTSICGCPRTFS